MEASSITPSTCCSLAYLMSTSGVSNEKDICLAANVLMGSFFGLPKSLSSSEAADLANEMIDFVGLSELKAYPAGDLTLVNQKKVEVARALATKPELLLLDEIMAGLNSTEVSQAIQLVKKIRGNGITIVMIEHVMHAIMNVCDRIIVLHHGEKIAEGTPQEIANNQRVIEIYLGA